MPAHGKHFAWQWWWIAVAAGVLLLIVLSALAVVGSRRRRARRGAPVYQPEPERDLDPGYAPAAEGRWGNEDPDLATDHFALDDAHAPEHQPTDDDAVAASRVSWSRGAEAAGLLDHEGAYGEPEPGHYGAVGANDEDPDAVQTDSIPVVSEADLSEAGYALVPEEGYPEVVEEGTYQQAEDADYEDAGYPDVVPRTPPDAAYRVADEPDGEYPDVAVPHAVPDVAHADDEAVDAQLADAPEPPEAAEAAEAAEALASDAERRAGRHAATDEEEPPELAPETPAAPAAPAPPGRPMIHLPLEDPYQMPDGYPIKASARFGLYYTPESELYHDTLAEIWFASEEVAQANGFVKDD
jgi:uncharacterized protein with LGFP repeats